MKVLIVTAGFFPINSPRSFRATELAKELARSGHQVDVLTHAHPQQGPLQAALGFRIIPLNGEPEVKPLSLGGKRFSYLVNRSLELLLDYPTIRYAHLTWNALKKVDRDYDLLITVAYPHAIHWGAAWFKKWCGGVAKVWVADCGDPFMGASMGKAFHPFYFGYLEKMFCRHCDFITVPIETAKSAYYSEFRHKIRVIPQGFKFEETQSLLKGYTPHQVPTFAFAGNISPVIRDPRPLLDNLLEKGHPFHFRIHTNAPALFDKYGDQLGKTIFIYPFVPRPTLIPILGSMDFLLNLENGVATQLPSKLIDYSLTGRPILSFDSSNPDWKTVDEFMQGNYAGAWTPDDMEQYRIEQVAQRFLELANSHA